MPDSTQSQEFDAQTLLDAAPDGVFVADRQARCVYANRALCRMLGMGSSDLLGRTLAELIPKGDAIRLEAARRAMLGGATHTEEWLLRHKEGQWVPVEVSASILPNGTWHSYVRDISARKQLEEQARAGERTLASIFELLPVGVWIFDREGNILSSNQAAHKIWCGVRYVGPENYGVYKSWWYTTGEPVKPEEWPVVRALNNGATSVGELLRIQCFDGTFKTVIVSAGPLYDAQGQLIGAVAVNEDITELYGVQRHLEESEAIFRTVFDLLPVGLYVSDRQGHILHGNAAGEAIWQGIRHVGPNDLAEYKAWWADTGEPLTSDDWAIARAVRKGQTSRSELLRIQCFDGTFKTVLNWAAPIRDKDGEITGAVAVNQDVTSLIRTQDQLRTAVRDREHILAVVAHDLRNPLNSIITRAALLAQKATKIPQAQDCVSTANSIAEVSRRMAGLVDDLLAVSVVRSGGSMLKLEPVRPIDLLLLASQQANPLLEVAGLSLGVQYADDLPLVHVDTGRILRVFSNLLDNAAKFTEPHGRIEMRADAAPGAVLFSIANTGPPVPTEDLELLFQPFWQSTDEDRRGAGLGLSICRSIIEAHGGTVWAEPAPGMRLKVMFLIPRGRLAPADAPLPQGRAIGL
jgi:PAS domain S-box-containing protein